MSPAPLLKVSAEIPAELEPWAAVLLKEYFPDGTVVEAVKGAGSWIRVTGWMRQRRRLNRLQRTVEAWQGRRFHFQDDPSVLQPVDSTIPVQKIGRFVLAPESNRRCKGAIRLRQGQAFGTGLHETTRLILRYLSSLPKEALEGMELIDLGSGSGVLGFAALDRGASKVWAVEKDKAAREELKHNREINQVDPKRMVVLPSGFPSARLRGVKVPLILANIRTHVHVALMKQMKSHLKTGGRLILSGIYKDDEATQVRAAARRQGLKLGHRAQLRKWHLIELQK